MLTTKPLNISFRRALVGNKLTEWLSLVGRISNVELVEGSDYFRWRLTNCGLFSVRSLYLYNMGTQTPFRHKKIWKMKIPLKIKICLARKNWKGSQKCICFNGNETIQHLFLDCPLTKTIWRIIFFATRLTQPRSINHMFGGWLSNQNKRIRNLIWVGWLPYTG